MKYNKVFVLAFAAIILAVVASGTASAATIPEGKSKISSGGVASWTGSSGSTDISPPETLGWYVTYKNELTSESINAMSNYKFGSGGQVWGHTTANSITPGSTWTSSSQFTTTAQNLLDIYRDHYYWNGGRTAETLYVMQDLY